MHTSIVWLCLFIQWRQPRPFFISNIVQIIILSFSLSRQLWRLQLRISIFGLDGLLRLFLFNSFPRNLNLGFNRFNLRLFVCLLFFSFPFSNSFGIIYSCLVCHWWSFGPLHYFLFAVVWCWYLGTCFKVLDLLLLLGKFTFKRLLLGKQVFNELTELSDFRISCTLALAIELVIFSSVRDIDWSRLTLTN